MILPQCEVQNPLDNPFFTRHLTENTGFNDTYLTSRPIIE